MPIVKWPIPIIGKLADYRPIIGAPLIFTRHSCQVVELTTTATSLIVTFRHKLKTFLFR